MVRTAPSRTPEPDTVRVLANAIRALAMDAVEAANSGHPGMPLGMADVATVLFTEFLKFDAADPDWPDRDRFVLSAGHGSMLLYALLYLTGSPDIALDDLRRFRQLHAKCAGHPEYGLARGIETTTGPLGQGLANAVGMALAERLANARLGDGAVDHHTYVIAGDGCLMEGISHEAIDLAGHLQLGRLVVLWDDNRITIDGPTGLSTSIDQRGRFEAAGWDFREVDGHDVDAVRRALAAARESDQPSLIACHTIIGYGAPRKQGTEQVHGAPLGAEEVAAAREALDWSHAPFEVPDAILAGWRAAGARGSALNADWKRRNPGFAVAPDLSGLGDAVEALKAALAAQPPEIATRKASEIALGALAPHVPALIGGSADLTGSNLTRAKGQRVVVPGDFGGSYVHYGIREHAMAAAMNGIALHGGFIPYGGTFLAFADYCRPAIRMSALMGQRVVYVMTHDSIGLGEDGPTHQPVEHLASLRAIPNLAVIRPADAMETAEAWQCALLFEHGPSALCLSRQALPPLRVNAGANNLVATGGYVLREVEETRDATIIATGSEVSLAVIAADLLAEQSIAAAIVSMPCWEYFARQPASYRQAVLGTVPRVAVEAAASQGWERWTGEHGAFVGIDTFGASGPGGEVYSHFKVTAERVVETVRALIGRAY